MDINFAVQVCSNPACLSSVMVAIYSNFSSPFLLLLLPPQPTHLLSQYPIQSPLRNLPSHLHLQFPLLFSSPQHTRLLLEDGIQIRRLLEYLAVVDKFFEVADCHSGRAREVSDCTLGEGIDAAVAAGMFSAERMMGGGWGENTRALDV